MSNADSEFKPTDPVENTVDAPSGTDTVDDEYKSRSGQYQIPVQKDSAPVEDPIDPATADSDETLGKIESLQLYPRANLVNSERRQRGHRQEQHPQGQSHSWC